MLDISLPPELIVSIFGYLPLFYYQNLSHLNRYYCGMYQKKVWKQFPNIGHYQNYRNVFIYYSSHYLLTSVYTNLRNIIVWYREIKVLYRILFQPTDLKVTPCYQTIQPYLCQFKPTIPIDLGLYDLSKRQIKRTPMDPNDMWFWEPSIPIGFDQLSQLIEHIEDYPHIYYFCINCYYYRISGWIQYLVDNHKTVGYYYRARSLMKWLILLVGEHISCFVVLDELDGVKKWKPKKRERGWCQPEWIYCSGKTCRGKRCRRKIPFKAFRQMGMYRWYCHSHSDSDKELISASHLVV